MARMPWPVRQARPADGAAALLYESAAAYYDAYAGDAAVARALVSALFPVRGHAASWEVCWIAEDAGPAPADAPSQPAAPLPAGASPDAPTTPLAAGDSPDAPATGPPAGVLAGFPAAHADARARRFVLLSLPRVGLRRWPGLARHLRAAARISPVAPAGSWYVDALAVELALRRRGVASALMGAAEAAARAAGARTLALDTGLENAEAQALYEALGFRRGVERRAPSARMARELGGIGFVTYTKPIA